MQAGIFLTGAGPLKKLKEDGRGNRCLVLSDKLGDSLPDLWDNLRWKIEKPGRGIDQNEGHTEGQSLSAGSVQLKGRQPQTEMIKLPDKRVPLDLRQECP